MIYRLLSTNVGLIFVWLHALLLLLLTRTFAQLNILLLTLLWLTHHFRAKQSFLWASDSHFTRVASSRISVQYDVDRSRRRYHRARDGFSLRSSIANPHGAAQPHMTFVLTTIIPKTIGEESPFK